MSTDFCLDPETHDLLLQNNDLVLCTDSDQLIQRIKINLQYFITEWFLNNTVGLPFFQEILVKNPNFPNIDNIIKATILDIDGALEFLDYKSEYKPVERKYYVSFKIQSIYGSIEILNTAIGA